MVEEIWIPQVDKEVCTDCGDCIAACPAGWVVGWAAAPGLAAAAALFWALPTAVPRGLSTLGALGLVLIFVVICRLQPTTDHAVMGIGALLWLWSCFCW